MVEGVEKSSVSIMNYIDGKEYTVPKKKIYKQRPHIVADNHFSGENVMEYIGQQGFGITTTCRRDRFPPGLKDFFHHDKVPSTDKRTRVARFEQPILAVKRIKVDGANKAYCRTHVSFQSTGATNLSGVNNLLSLTLYVQPKFRGPKNYKLAWATEQNEAREIYLNHYHGVDSADHMIKNTGNRFISWKYWHSPYLHAMSLGIIACYDMYKECCEGELDASWKISEKHRMTYSEFRLKLSKQMLLYDPRKEVYAGDNKFRICTQQPRKRRRSKDLSVSEESFPDTGVTAANLIIARTLPRFCTTINDIQRHFGAIEKKSNQGTCEVCGANTYWKCGLCGIYMCLLDKRHWNGARCVFLHHQENFFGLSRSDYLAVLKKGWSEGERKTKKDIEMELSNWKPPNDAALERNTRFLNRLRLDMQESTTTASNNT